MPRDPFSWYDPWADLEWIEMHYKRELDAMEEHFHNRTRIAEARAEGALQALERTMRALPVIQLPSIMLGKQG